MSTILENLNWRYATKKFDATKKVSSENLETLTEVLRLTPSSYGLQPLKFLVIENPAVRAKLLEKSYGQNQVVDASHLIVMCAFNDVNDSDIDAYVQNTATIRETPIEQLAGFGKYMKQTLGNLDTTQKNVWASKQAYIALGQFLHACADLRIDATPMEGFQPEGYDEVLGLKEKNLHAVLVCPIGYRSVEDQNQHLKKVRKAKSDIIEFV
jgi:nitroreductase